MSADRVTNSGFAPKATPESGDWFAVPLGDGEHALGRVARYLDPVVFGYFFPLRGTLALLDELVSTTPPKPSNSHVQRMFSVLAFSLENWPVRRSALSGEFDPRAWPLVVFTRSAMFREERHYAVSYSEADLLTTTERQIRPEEAAVLPPAGHAGAQYIREWLPSTFGHQTLAIPSKIRKRRRPVPAPTESLTIELIDATDEMLDQLQSKLAAAASSVPGGEYEGHVRGAGDLTLFMYADDADALFGAVVPAVRATLPDRPFRVVRNYGREGAELRTDHFS